MRPAWRPDGDALRGVAILAVLVFHAVPSALRGGFVGVDVFFVLSGYLVGRIVFAELAASDFSFARFYGRRARRILPALVTLLVATTLAAPRFLHGGDLAAFGAQVGASALFANNLVAWKHAGYFDAAAAWKPLHHLWSLGIEEQFYLVFPAIAWLLARRARPHVRDRWTGVALGLLAGASFLLCVVVTDFWPDAAFFLPFTRFWELLVGAWIAWRELGDRLPRRPAFVRVGSIVGAALLVVSFTRLTEAGGFPGWRAAMPVVGTALLLATGAEGPIQRTVLRFPPLSALGRASYPAYLWHWPLLVFARYRQSDELGPAQAIALTAIAVALAFATMRFVEEPIRRGALSRRRATPLVLVAALALVAVVARAATRASAATSARAELARWDNYDVGDRWRTDEHCVLVPDRGKGLPFGDVCLGGRDDGRPLALLWGDSHAAHLWPGLDALAGPHGFRLAELAAVGCPALLPEQASEACRAIEAATLALVEKTRPDTVIVSERFRIYPREATIEGTRAVALRLRALGVRRVVVVGPSPEWFPTLRSVLLAEMDERGLAEPPLTMSRGAPTRDAPLEAELASIARSGAFDFVPAIPVLCAGSSCRTRVSDEGTDLMFFDAHHLSPEGSAYFCAKIADAIFVRPGPRADGSAR